MRPLVYSTPDDWSPLETPLTILRHISASLFLLVGLALASSAHAHGAEPLPEKIHGFDSGEWVFHTNFGIITSEKPNRYVCEEAFNGGDDFRVAALGLQTWVMFTPDAIYRTEDGCEFEKTEQLPKIPSDVASLRGGAVAYVVNTDSADTTGVFVSEDAGASFRKVGVDVSQRQFTRVDFIDDKTLLVSAYAKDAESQGAVELIEVALSDDSMTMLDVGEGLRYPYLLDVEDDNIIWQASTGSGQSLFWGTVSEPTRDEIPLDAWPNGVVLSDDGSEFWIAAPNAGSKGLAHMPSSDMMVDISSDHSGLCVGRAADTVYACARSDREGHDLSRVVGEDVEPALTFTDIAGPRDDCPAGSDVATTCPAVWPELATGLGIEVEEDEGESDDNTDDGEKEDSICSSVGQNGPVGVHVFLLVLTATAVLRRRSRTI
jgi:hypothetical protein